MLIGKKVVLGVTGSIAAYKMANVASMLVRQHCDVHVILTKNAAEFIAPVTFETLTKNPCLTDNFDRRDPSRIHHIELGQSSDLILVAPASADILGKAAHGIADDLLTSTIIAATCPVLFAPAMNTHMYLNPVVQDNIRRLKSFGYMFVEPAVGHLACDAVGVGKLPDEAVLAEVVAGRLVEEQSVCMRGAEPEGMVGVGKLPDEAVLAEAVARRLAEEQSVCARGAEPEGTPGIGRLSDSTDSDGTASADQADDKSPEGQWGTFVEDALSQDLSGRRILVTAGPTRESIDPVRFITNHSTGKMGYAVARRAKERGAEVTLVTGPVELDIPEGVECVRITTAEEMYRAVMDRADSQDMIVKAAAVADYRPRQVNAEKTKKRDGSLVIELERTKDILAELGQRKRKDQCICGFSMETEHVLQNSRAKLIKKNVDMIAANSLRESGAGFGTDTNHLVLITEDGEIDPGMLSKEECADKLLSVLEDIRKRKLEKQEGTI